MATTRPESPWRRLFEEVRAGLGNQRDAEGMLGSINWLRKQMAARGANPNVVRNIIYRDKGKLADKRALFDILKSLHARSSQAPLQAPELEVILAAGSTVEQEVAQLLGREKRRAYSGFVGAVRTGEHPKLLVTGKPGSGKTLLFDYIQQALELPPQAAQRVLRLEFSSGDLAASLTQLAQALGVGRELIEARLVKLGGSSAYAVQADAQADVARVILDAIRTEARTLVLLLHLSQALNEQYLLGATPLRLNTPEVSRVNAAEWTWLTLLEPLSQQADLSLLVSAAQLPARVQGRLGFFEGLVKLNPPTVAEARRFVKARLPQLTQTQQEAVVQRSGRSFEELRTLTLLAEIRAPLPEDGSDREHVKQLSHLLNAAGDKRLRDFLAALAVAAMPEFPTFEERLLFALRDGYEGLSSLEQAFLDPAPGQRGVYRSFSRQFARSLRQRFQETESGRYQELNARAALHFRVEAEAAPGGEAAGRYLHHLFEARDWRTLEAWLKRWSIPQSLLRRLWQAAEAEVSEIAVREAIAFQVAAHYVRLGSYTHPDAHRAFEALAGSSDPRTRLWTTLKQAEGAVLEGRIEEAEGWLGAWDEADGAETGLADPSLAAELALVRASLARWHSQLEEAARLVDEVAKPRLGDIPADDAEGRLTHAKVAVWAGLIAKDRGRLEEALQAFSGVGSGDDLILARVAFQRGDVQLQLGRFDGALESLSEAVQRAYRSEAPVQEQARYLSRRASLHRLQGDLVQAGEDFRAATSILQDERSGVLAERAFWRAKVEDERALYLLARGEYDDALFQLAENAEVFQGYQRAFGVDAGYRLLRSQLRLALAYGLRGLRQPLCYPILHLAASSEGQADLLQAERLILRAIRHLSERAHDQLAFEGLRRDALQLASFLVADPARGVNLAEEALELSRFGYQEALSLCCLGSAYLRLDEPENALSASRLAETALRGLRTPNERGDLACLAWQRTTEMLSVLAQGDLDEAVLLLGQSLSRPDLAPYRLAMARRFGEALEANQQGDWRTGALESLFGLALQDANLRFSDALARAVERQPQTGLAVPAQEESVPSFEPFVSSLERGS